VIVYDNDKRPGLNTKSFKINSKTYLFEPLMTGYFEQF
jgi:hypothetical protein